MPRLKKEEKQDKYALLKEQVGACFEQRSPYADFKVEVNEYKDELTVVVSQMYEFLPLNFATLMKLSEVFKTTDFKVNNWSHGGCETCDYGSKYAHEFVVKKGA